MNWHDFFTYDADTGNLIWKRRDLRSFANERMGKVWNTRFAGNVAGGKHNCGYTHVSVNGNKKLAHIVIWEMHYGPVPDGKDLDHCDTVKTNNRIGNLRPCSNDQNAWNTGIRKMNKSGFKGVAPHKGAWVAQIRANGKNNYLGRFRSPEEAHAAYCEAAKEMHGQFARTA